MLIEFHRDGWDLLEPHPCGRHHLLEDHGPLSLLLSCVAPGTDAWGHISDTWAALGNREAWWCYGCGGWGLEADRRQSAFHRTPHRRRPRR